MPCKHRPAVVATCDTLEPAVNAVLAETGMGAVMVIYCPECDCNQVMMHRDSVRDEHAEDRRAFSALYEALRLVHEALKEGEKSEQKTNETCEKLN